MALGAIPLYLWARRLVAPLWAVLVVALYLAMPGFIYTAEILTENAYRAGHGARAVRDCRRDRAPIGAAAAARARCDRARRGRPAPGRRVPARLSDGDRARALSTRSRPLRASGGASSLAEAPAVLALARARPASRPWRYVAYERGRGQLAVRAASAPTSNIANAHYEVRFGVRSWVLYHFGELALSVGILPVSALIVLLGLACRRATAPKRRRTRLPRSDDGRRLLDRRPGRNLRVALLRSGSRSG